MQEGWWVKKMNKRRRTKKIFIPYNDYQDRPFGLKWGTAFAIDELNKVITDNKEKENKTIIELPQMSRDDMDKVLQEAFLKSKKVSIQLNMKDDFGNYFDSLVGKFEGYADSEFIYIESKSIAWHLIRNISLVDAK